MALATGVLSTNSGRLGCQTESPGQSIHHPSRLL